MATNSEETSKDSNQEILRIARERFLLAEEAESEIRREGLEDLQFRAGDQWPEDVKQDRNLDARPCLTINRIPQFIRQITNDQRQNRPAIKVFPVDDKADVETARIYQGLIRHIEYNSSADIAYDTAFEGAVTKGFGYFRIVTDYVNPMSFEQEILIKRIRNSFSVYLDPNSKEPDGSDASWGFIFEDVPKDEFKNEYKDSELSRMEDWKSLGNQTANWATESTVRVAEYFYKDFKSVEIAQLSSGETIEKSQYTNEMKLAGITIDAERTTNIPVIKWCKINGTEILAETTWPGRWIPIIPVYGDELDVNGERILEGVVRHAKDSQRMYNYWASTETETIALAPKAPWIVAEGQIPKEYEAQWKSSNRKNHAFLPYKPTALAGQPVGAPQRNVFEPAVGAITNARMQASEDLKATTGIYDAALGSRGNESSGVAIQRRNNQSQTSNFHFIDNLTRSLRHAGRVIVDLIPKIYDTARTARIIGDEGEQEIVKINQLFQDKGEDKIFNMGAGQYDVAVETGPSFATKRQEALASMLDLTRAYPQIAQVAGDLMVKNMDWPGASEIAERLKKTLPPGIGDDPKDAPQLPPQIKGQMDQMNQMIEQLTAKLNEANEKEKSKSIELESKERIEFKKLENALILKQMDLQGSAANALFAAELASIKERMGLLDINQPFDEDPMPPQNPNQNFNESGPEQAAIQNAPQPTGGLAPGNFMEE